MDIMNSRLHDAIKGTAQFADLVIHWDDMRLLKNRGRDWDEIEQDGGAKVLFVSEMGNMGWLDDNILDPKEKVYGVHWEVHEPHALWQLTSQNYLRVDVTARFGSAYRLIAYTDLNDDSAASLKAMMKAGTIEAQSCGQDAYKGYGEDIFLHVPAPNASMWPCRWRVTNCSHILPGYAHSIARKASDMQRMQIVSNTFKRHPNDGYVVQFNAVPFGIFERYWRKPINLDRAFHTARRKGYGKSRGHATPSASVEVLEFDLTLLRSHKTFFADFSFLYSNRTRMGDAKIAIWMLRHARGFRVLDDSETPFVKDDAEFLFTTEFL